MNPDNNNDLKEMSFFSEEITEAAHRALEACRTQGHMLVAAESCTGGLIGAALTSIPGSSDTFYASFVTYANSAKETLLSVAPSLIRAEGAVSEKVAMAMARGALEESPAGVAVAVTGIAGPDGAVDGKPVGTVHLAAITVDGEVLHKVQLFSGNRYAVRSQTVVTALNMVCEILAK